MNKHEQARQWSKGPDAKVLSLRECFKFWPQLACMIGLHTWRNDWYVNMGVSPYRDTLRRECTVCGKHQWLEP